MADDYWDQPASAKPVAHEPWGEEPPMPGSEDDYGGGRVVELRPKLNGANGHKRPQADEAGPRKLPLLWFDAIEVSLDVADFVQGLLIDNSSIIVFGASNSGKTFWVTDLALHIAAGMAWMGRRVECGGVIYCTLEGTIGFRNRVAAWRMEKALDGYDLPFAAIPAALDLRNPAGPDADGLIAAVTEAVGRIKQPVRLIVIDTLSRALAGGAENDPEDMGSLVRTMDRIRAETGAAVLFIHHSGKDETRGARGHSLLKGAVDTEIEIVADDETQTRCATVLKQRELPKGDVFPFTLKVIELGVNRHDEPVTTCVAEPEDAGNKPIGRRLTGHNKRAREVLTELIAESGQKGHRGTPDGCPSVPEDWWRERFYDRAMPGADPEAKKKAFRRAADALGDVKAVGMAAKRVWIVPDRNKQPHPR